VDPPRAGWYRFRAAPGTRAMVVTVRGRVECWVEGRPCGRQDLGGGRVRFRLPKPGLHEAVAALRIEPERGEYGGAAIPEPVVFECGEGRMKAGDWSLLESLQSYSGGIRYMKEFSLRDDGRKRRVLLDLGEVVSSAEVRVNGKPAGARVAPPWRWDVTGLVGKGANTVEVLVFNTLANHYTTIPTRYRGKTTSGLLGPARIVLEE
jgi:hypothetical protein